MGSPSLPGASGVTQLRTFAYNSDQRLQSVHNPENGTTTYTYNADGSMATKTDANTQVLSAWVTATLMACKATRGRNCIPTMPPAGC
jgi:YD repeat-containing protein